MWNRNGHSKSGGGWGAMRRPVGCTCTVVERATGKFKRPCATHNPETFTVTPADVGLPQELYDVLRYMAEGHGIPKGAGAEVKRLQVEGYIAAIGERPEDGWRLTEAGGRMIQTIGTFRVLVPSEWWPRQWDSFTKAVRRWRRWELAAVAVGTITAVLVWVLS